MSNVAADDHGDTPAAATDLSNANQSVAGRIDFAGDKDVFAFRPLDGLRTIVRITDRALGIKPVLRVLAQDGQTVLFEGDLASSDQDFVYAVLENRSAGTTLYAEVRDEDAGAVGGLYEISVGAAVASDPAFFTLAVAKSGSGVVVSDPAGISCGTACAHEYQESTVVTLTASPAAGSGFAGWLGACTGTGACVVTMDDSKQVTATFALLSFPFHVAACRHWEWRYRKPAGWHCMRQRLRCNLYLWPGGDAQCHTETGVGICRLVGCLHRPWHL